MCNKVELLIINIIILVCIGAFILLRSNKHDKMQGGGLDEFLAAAENYESADDAGKTVFWELFNDLDFGEKMTAIENEVVWQIGHGVYSSLACDTLLTAYHYLDSDGLSEVVNRVYDFLEEQFAKLPAEQTGAILTWYYNVISLSLDMMSYEPEFYRDERLINMLSLYQDNGNKPLLVESWIHHAPYETITDDKNVIARYFVDKLGEYLQEIFCSPQEEPTVDEINTSHANYIISFLDVYDVEFINGILQTVLGDQQGVDYGKILSYLTTKYIKNGQDIEAELILAFLRNIGFSDAECYDSITEEDGLIQACLDVITDEGSDVQQQNASALLNIYLTYMNKYDELQRTE